jgi:hypothetical protein
VIKVNDINKAGDLGASSKAKKTSGGDSFSLYLKETMKPSSSPVGGSAGISVSDAIFAAQMVSGEEEREKRRQMLRRGDTLLEKLEEIRDGLLLGYISKDKLIEISRYVKETKINTADEKLAELIGEIELRVEVELAKLMK